MRLLCNNKNHPGYKNYGAKGIRYEERWDDFVLFLEDMGQRPEGTNGLELIDKSKDFCKLNCRWAMKLRGRQKIPENMKSLKSIKNKNISQPKKINLIIEMPLFNKIKKQAMLKSLEENTFYHTNDLIRELLQKSFEFGEQMDMFQK